jgi:hypothetical protein
LRTIQLRVVAAGLTGRLRGELRCTGRDVEQADSVEEALHRLRRKPGARALVVSEFFPGAGDLLAAVEADQVLGIRTLVAVVGDRTALSAALGRRGVPVVQRRGAGRWLDGMLRANALVERASNAARHHARRVREVINLAGRVVPDAAMARDEG